MRRRDHATGPLLSGSVRRRCSEVPYRLRCCFRLSGRTGDKQRIKLAQHDGIADWTAATLRLQPVWNSALRRLISASRRSLLSSNSLIFSDAPQKRASAVVRTSEPAGCGIVVLLNQAALAVDARQGTKLADVASSTRPLRCNKTRAASALAVGSFGARPAFSEMVRSVRSAIEFR